MWITVTIDLEPNISSAWICTSIMLVDFQNSHFIIMLVGFCGFALLATRLPKFPLYINFRMNSVNFNPHPLELPPPSTWWLHISPSPAQIPLLPYKISRVWPPEKSRVLSPKFSREKHGDPSNGEGEDRSDRAGGGDLRPLDERTGPLQAGHAAPCRRRLGSR